jgi:PAS domain S-box-containing protein
VPLGAVGWKEILEALDEGVALLDAGGRIHYANLPLGRFFGRKPGELEGRAIGEAIPEIAEAIDWSQAARSAIERARTVRLARLALGEGAHLDLHLRAIDVSGRPESLALLTVKDVSEAVRAEAALLRQTRTQALANLGDSVAHEIRNPLNSIHMNVQLLREGLHRRPPDVPALDRTADTVQREIRRLDRVVRDFVQFSRPPALNLVRGSINQVVRAALDTLDGQIREKDLKVVQDLQSARPVLLDRDRLQRAIYNVLLNAVQVLPKGGTITCRSRDEERHCLLEISDDGPGLDRARAARLFDLFYTTKPGGTGLGLPIANRIAEEHGGRMAAASVPGHGATFAFFLPWEGPPAPREAGPTTVAAPEAGLP